MNQRASFNRRAGAVQDVSDQLQVPVFSILTFDHLLRFMKQHDFGDMITKMEEYYAEYGCGEPAIA